MVCCARMSFQLSDCDPPDMLQCAPRGMGVVGNDRGVLLVFASRIFRAHHQVLMPECRSPPANARFVLQPSSPAWQEPSYPVELLCSAQILLTSRPLACGRYPLCHR